MSRRGRAGRAGRPERVAEGPPIDPAAVGPQLLLPCPPRLGLAFADALAAALAPGRVAAVLLDPAACPAGERPELVEACRARCRAASAALFLCGDPAAVIELGADGCLLDAVAAVEPARRLLGLERPIGVATGGSRHAAMEAGEAGADWLLLGEGLEPAPLVELVGWWHELFVLPCAAPCRSAGEARALLAAGADFLLPPAAIWDDPGAALAPFRAALEAG